MLHRYLMIVGLVVCSVNTSQGQANQPTGSYITVPGENILLLVAAQPSAPIRFEEAKLLMNTESHELEISYSLHNVGAKSIRSITAVMWTSFGTGGTFAPRPIKSILKPGDVVRNDSTKQTVNLSAETREKLKLKGAMMALIVLLVEDVRFEDGSTYSDRSTSKALLSYFEDVSDKIERLQSIDRVGLKRMR